MPPRDALARPATSPFTRDVAADLVASSRERIYDALGTKPKARGAFPYLVGRMVDAIEASLRVGGPAEVLLTYDDWADLASDRRDADGNPAAFPVKSESVRAAFSKARDAFDVPGTTPTVRVSLQTPQVRGTEEQHGLAGMRVAFVRGEKDARLVGDALSGAALPHPLAPDLERAREWRRVREEIAAEYDGFVTKLNAIGGARFGPVIRGIGTCATLTLRRWGVPVRPLLALLLVSVLTLGATTAFAYGVWKLAHVFATTSPQRYQPIPEPERPSGAAPQVLPLSGKGWSGVVEIRPRGVEGVLLTFVPETLPPPSDGKAGLAFLWHVAEQGKPYQTVVTAWPQLFFRYSTPRADAVPLLIKLGIPPADVVDVHGVPIGGKVTASGHVDRLPEITAEVSGADGAVERVVVTPVPAPSAPASH